MSAGSQIVFDAEGARVISSKRGSATLLRFEGASNPSLVAWVAKGLRPPAALQLADLSGVSSEFIQSLIRSRPPVALVAPSAEISSWAEGRLPVISCAAAILDSGSIEESVAMEKEALAEIASRFQANPLWRRVDQSEAWLCPFCGTSVEDARIHQVLKPDAIALRAVRRHFLECCAAWRGGRRTPLPAMVLDAFLVEINKRKTAEDTERRRIVSKQIETLQERVESVKELERSVSEAQRRQLHLLPIVPRPDTVADIAVVYRPLQTVSGDFLDFYALNDNRFGVAIGDVSGHGIEAAIIMGMAKMAIRVRSERSESLRHWIAEVNRDLFAELRRVAFVTAFVATIDRSTRGMRCVRAGHTKTLLRRASGRCEALDAGGLPLGADAGPRFEQALEELEVHLSPGDILLMYTDGVIEAGVPDEFGLDRLKSALMAAPGGESADNILISVVGTLDAYLGGAALSDDVTLIALKIL